MLTQIVADDQDMPAGVDPAALCQEVLDEAVGLGPLEPLLAAADVTEIMVNRHDEIYVERQGRLYRHPAAFSSEQSVRWAIDRVVTPLGRRIDEAAPMVDARLPDGSRMHAIIPPAAIRGASLTIRKFPGRSLTLDALTRGGSLSTAMAAFLAFGVRARRNLIVSGGTGSGKTTLLNVLSNEIPDAERVITIEDAAELRLEHAHRVALEARPPNAEGKGRIDIRELVRNALRMRPDRIVVGECRGGEAFDMLTAMNTGHEGSLTTLHANSPRDALARLEAMVLMAGLDLPLAAVRAYRRQRRPDPAIGALGRWPAPGDVHRRTDWHRKRPHPAAGAVPFRSPAGIRGLRRVPRFRTGRKRDRRPVRPCLVSGAAIRGGRRRESSGPRHGGAAMTGIAAGLAMFCVALLAGRMLAARRRRAARAVPWPLSALHRARIRRRASMFERQLSVALPMLSSSLRAGAALNTALRHLAENGEAPLSQELGPAARAAAGHPLG